MECFALHTVCLLSKKLKCHNHITTGPTQRIAAFGLAQQASNLNCWQYHKQYTCRQITQPTHPNLNTAKSTDTLNQLFLVYYSLAMYDLNLPYDEVEPVVHRERVCMLLSLGYTALAATHSTSNRLVDADK